ncbi:hypothetical protein BGY98DRAFT_1095042 [Russula aff. rugulosa BPL654]|nr:hypothetical protein BGY98DRAFT_1095042 [Russula aff. rugulosa BPL654]
MAARDEKDILQWGAPRYQRSKWTVLGLVALLASVFAVVFLHADILYGSSHNGVAKLCAQSDALYPENHARLWKSLGHDYDNDAFLTRAVAWLGGAVRIPTESFDSMGPIGEDKRWEAFRPFQDYLIQSFPLMCATIPLVMIVSGE